MTTPDVSDLLDSLLIRESAPVLPAGASIQEKFESFHVRNPAVYVGLVSLARQARQAGRRRLGMKQLFEVLRWGWMIEGLPDEREDYKLCNSYTSRYARLIMAQESDLDDVFETRALTA